MREIFEEAILTYNLPFTLLLGVVLLYWVFVAIGLASHDAFDVDLDLDSHMDVDAGDLGHGDHGGGHGDHGGHGSVLQSILRFVNASDVPLMIILSILAVSMWMVSIIGNHYLNPGHNMWIATGILAGNLFLSAVLTRVITSPLKPLMRALKKGAEEHDPVVGETGVVKTNEVSARHGQVEVDREGAILLLNARVPEGSPPVTRGTAVLVIDEDKEKQIYTIKPIANLEPGI